MTDVMPFGEELSTSGGRASEGTAGDDSSDSIVPNLIPNGTHPDIPRDPGGFGYDNDLFTTTGVPTPEEQARRVTPPGPGSMPSRYGAVARRYWEAGWQPLPLPPGAKFPPPSGYTGKTAYEKELTAAQVADWAKRQRINNIGLRMPSRVVAIDVDAYTKGKVTKPGAETLAQLIEQYGPLPPTVSSNAREGIGGQLFYRLPELDQPVILPGVLGPGIEAIQHHHRYSVVWPSKHPDAEDAIYRWRMPDPAHTGDDWWKHWVEPSDEWFIPNVDDLPLLPEAWCHIRPIGGKDVERTASEAPLGSRQILDALDRWQHDADLDPRLPEQILNRYVTSVARGEARHDSCMSALAWACKAGEAGLINAGTVIDTLHSMFSADTSERFVRGEFESMLAWAAAQGQQCGAVYRAEWDRKREEWRERQSASAIPSQKDAPEISWDNVEDDVPVTRSVPVTCTDSVGGEVVQPAPEAEVRSTTQAEAPSAVEQPEKPVIVFRRASQVRVRKTDWLWDTTPEGAVPTSGGRIPKDMLTMAAGLPGTGKSQWGIWLTAQVTNGTLPGCWYGKPRNVIYAATEDDWERTIAPRLIAAGADLDRVFHVVVRTVDMKHVQLCVPEHHDALGEFAQENEVSLVVFDPMLSHLGGKINANSEAEVRAALEPLVRAAAKYEFTVLGLSHFNKNTGDSDPLNRLMGSRGFSALLRALIVFAKDKDAEDEETTEVRYVLSQAKNNLGRTDMPSYSYTIASAIVDTDEGEAYVSRFVLGDETETSVEAQMASAGRSEEEREISKDCKGWLRAYLMENGGQQATTDISREAKKENYSRATLYRAKKELRLVGKSTGFGGAKLAMWALPGS